MYCISILTVIIAIAEVFSGGFIPLGDTSVEAPIKEIMVKPRKDGTPYLITRQNVI